jgi:hypothetical protein
MSARVIVENGRSLIPTMSVPLVDVFADQSAVF